MTQTERVSAVAALGFTERQAAFLVLVMLHAGVCLGRQYCTFAGIVRGQKMADFFQKLTAKRYATPYPCGHNKARVYHVAILRNWTHPYFSFPFHSTSRFTWRRMNAKRSA